MRNTLSKLHHFSPNPYLQNSFYSISKPSISFSFIHTPSYPISLSFSSLNSKPSNFSSNVFSYWANEQAQEPNFDDGSTQFDDLAHDSPVYQHTLRLVECSMFASVAGLAYLLSDSLAIESYFGCFFALPIVITSMRWGVAAGRKTMVATAVLLFVLSGPVKALTYLLMHGLLGFTMGSMWRISIVCWWVAILVVENCGGREREGGGRGVLLTVFGKENIMLGVVMFSFEYGRCFHDFMSSKQETAWLTMLLDYAVWRAGGVIIASWLRVNWRLSIFVCMLVRALGALGYVLTSSFLIRENILALITVNIHATLNLIFNTMGFTTVPSMSMVYSIFGTLLLVNSSFCVLLLHILYALFLTRLGLKASLILPRWLDRAL